MPRNNGNGCIWVTNETHQRLLDKRDALATKVDKLKRELNDLAHDEKDPNGNNPLQTAQEEIYRIDGQIYELDQTLSNTMIVTDDVNSCTTVSVGKRVLLHLHRHKCNCDDIEDEQLEVVIDGVSDYIENGDKVVTPNSPIGEAIIGATAGDERQFTSPKGDLIQIVIVSITSR